MKSNETLCVPCGVISTYMPWGFLIGGGLAGVYSFGPAWDRGAAYLMALALLILAVSYILKRLSNSLHR